MILPARLQRTLTLNLGKVAAPLPDVVASNIAASARGAVSAKADVNERIPEYFLLVHLHSRFRKELRTRQSALRRDAGVIGLVGAKTQLEGGGGVEDMGPGAAVVRGIVFAITDEVRLQGRLE